MRKIILLSALFLTLTLVIFAQQSDQNPENQLLYTTTIDENAGRIILNGRLLEPPYEIYATKDTLKINSHLIISRNPSPEPFTVDSNSSFEEKRYYKLFCAPFDSFAVWCEQVGSDSAMYLIKNLFESFEEIDSVYGMHGWSITVKAKHRDFPETFMFQPPLSEERKIEQKNYQDSIIVNKAIKYGRILNNGKLIAFCGGGELSTNNAQAKVDSINIIMTSENLDYQTKLAKLRNVIVSRCAEQILDNWKD
jgi:hypothetical protein